MNTKATIIKNVVIIMNVILFYYLIFVGRNQYIYSMSYIRCVLFMMGNSIFVYSYGLLNNQKKSYSRNVLIYIALYILLLFAITFAIGRSEFRFYNWLYAGQYKPFYTIVSQIKYGSKASIFKNIAGNSVMLMPLSFLLMIKNERFKNMLWQSAIVLPITIAIEWLQALSHTGAFDVDDIILNYFGTLVFTFIITRFHTIDKIRKVFNTDFGLKTKIKTGLFYSCLVAIVIFEIIILITK